jgi:hypothetical protein
MLNTSEPKRAPWRMLSVGSTVWCPFGNHGWRAATIIGLGKNRADRTIVHLAFENGGKGQRYAGELYWRRAELKGQDKPPRPKSESTMQSKSIEA